MWREQKDAVRIPLKPAHACILKNQILAVNTVVQEPGLFEIMRKHETSVSFYVHLVHGTADQHGCFV